MSDVFLSDLLRWKGPWSFLHPNFSRSLTIIYFFIEFYCVQEMFALQIEAMLVLGLKCGINRNCYFIFQIDFELTLALKYFPTKSTIEKSKTSLNRNFGWVYFG